MGYSQQDCCVIAYRHEEKEILLENKGMVAFLTLGDYYFGYTV